MSDVDIVAAIITAGVAEQDGLGCCVSGSQCKAIANRIINAGFKMRDAELEDRVEKLERWMRGDF